MHRLKAFILSSALLFLLWVALEALPETNSW